MRRETKKALWIFVGSALFIYALILPLFFTIVVRW
jgi:hypothetical protein